MRRLLLLGIMALASPVEAALDFTPTVTPYYSEGAEYTTVSFKDDKHDLSITLPRLWTCRGDASRLQLAPPNQSFAEAVIQSVPTKSIQPFDEPTVKALEQQVLTAVPTGSQNVTLISQQENTVMINGNPSYEFVISYQTLGQTFLRSVAFVNFPTHQLVCRFAAPKTVFDALYRPFRQCLYSWQSVEPAPATTVAQSR